MKLSDIAVENIDGHKNTLLWERKMRGAGPHDVAGGEVGVVHPV